MSEIRELTHSMLRLSWALPLFGLRQLAHFSVPTKANQESAAHALDAVSEVARSELGSTFKDLYTTGDDLQRRLVDAAFDLFRLDTFDPARWLSGDEAEPASRGTADEGSDTALGGEELKLVSYSIVSVQPGRERELLANASKILSHPMTAESFTSRVLSEYCRTHEVRSAEKRYLRVTYCVEGRWPRRYA